MRTPLESKVCGWELSLAERWAGTSAAEDYKSMASDFTIGDVPPGPKARHPYRECCARTKRAAYRDVLPAALTFAQRARAKEASLARPAAVSFRLRFGAALAGVLDFLTAAQRARCAARILAMPAALIFFRFRVAVAAGAGAKAPSSWPSSFSSASIRSLTSAARRNCRGVRVVKDRKSVV